MGVKMKKISFLLVVMGLVSVCLAQNENPRVAIIISKTSFKQHWGVTQMSAHGWGGVVNLAGIPYDCLFIEDVVAAKSLQKYDCLIFGQCDYIRNDQYSSLLKAIEGYLAKGGNVILEGRLAAFDEKALERNHEKLDNLLGIEYSGFQGDSEYRIRVAHNSHFITKNFERHQNITQHVANGLNIQQFIQNGKTLLELTDERHSYPFLISNETDKNRILLVNDFSTWAGIASFFRNNQPQVFYKNMIFNILIESIYYMVYGASDTPIPSLQVSNANLSAIIRLDADGSQNLNAQISTINYLNEIARESGVVSLYAWVSSGATKAGWQDLAPLGKSLEDLGGQIGTHSKFHHIDREMTDERWKEELDDAIQEIEFNMSDYGYDIGKVDGFINPGNTIHMDDYAQVAKRFGFYMTHGFEQDMPIGFGNFTWYNKDYKNFVVIENTPSPDYQWFYDPTWSYTTQQISAYEENIFDHLYENVQRGVIFNEMWHDYSITTQSQKDKQRIINESNIAFYDALKAKFNSSDIYCPTPADLRNKLLLMAQGNYSWQTKDNTIRINLDFSQVELDSLFEYTAGMGLRINNTAKKIEHVTINGNEHKAFNDQLIILAGLKNPKAEIEISLAENSSKEPRLLFVSKRMPEVSFDEKGLHVKVLTQNKAKFSFFAPPGHILLNADWFEWNRKGDSILKGFVTSDRTVVLTKINPPFQIKQTNLLIIDAQQTKGSLLLKVQEGAIDQQNEIYFSSEKEIKDLKFNGQKLNLEESQSNHLLLNSFEGEGVLEINY